MRMTIGTLAAPTKDMDGSILTIIGTIPWTIFLVYMGAMLGENWHSLLSYKLEIALVCIVICAIIAAAFHFYQKHKDNKHEAQ